MAQQTFSVWDYNRRKYDYYSSLGRNILDSVNDSIISKFSRNGHTAIGYVPEKAARTLPSNAIYVGTGDMAVGEVVDRSSSSDVFLAAGCIAAGIWVFWQFGVKPYMKKKR